MGFTPITLTNTYVTPALAVAQGQVSLSLFTAMTDGDATTIGTGATTVAQLAADGTLTVTVAANDDPDTTPTGDVYLVAELINGVSNRYYVSVPFDAEGGTVSLSALPHVQPTIP